MIFTKGSLVPHWVTIYGRRPFLSPMRPTVDPALAALCGSETRALTLGVLANAELPMSGYRIAKVADLPRPKVYVELAKAIAAGSVRKGVRGYRLTDLGIRALLRPRVRLFWSGDWSAPSVSRARQERAAQFRDFDDSWLNLSQYEPLSPNIAVKYAKEIERPQEKSPSRKTGWK